MKVSLNWLRRYVDVEADGLVGIFTALGLEVEGVKSVGVVRQDTLVVGEIQKIEPHPDADKLSVCRVCVGENDVRQIVCGAKNFKLYDHVPVALPGAILPGGVKIVESKLRGVLSQGMMCSGRELEIGSDHSGLLILDKSTAVGTILHDAIEVSNDVIFDLSVTSNRGDCLSYLGIARELGCKLRLPVKVPAESSLKCDVEQALVRNISIETDDCPCYYGFCISGVKIGQSPDWIVRDLQASGLNSVNNVVDICNWVMLETGNPLHAFDVNKIKDRSFTVRPAHNGESLLGLDGKPHVLNDRITVIADAERPLVVAGIMGSIDAEIDDSSTDIMLESACFSPAAIMQSSRMLNLSTDSSYRFSRSVDGSACKHSCERAVEMILSLCGGKLVQYIPAKEFRHEKRIITVTDKFIADKLGFEIEHDVVRDILSRLGFTLEEIEGGFGLIIPNFRPDIERPIDIVEECLRVYGTDKIPSTPVIAKGEHRHDHKAFTFSSESRRTLSEHGFFECYNYSLVSSETIRNLLGSDPLVGIKNPMSADQECYRQSLLPGLLDTLRLNIQNGNSEGRFFEIGKIVTQFGEQVNECLAVSFIASEEPFGWTLNPHKIGFEYIKRTCFAVLGHCVNTDQVKFSLIKSGNLWQPEYSAEYSQLGRSGLDVRCGLLNKRSLRQFFDIKQNIWAAEMVIADPVFLRKNSTKTYKPFSQFPRVTKDISVIVDRDEPAGEVKYLLEKIAKKSVSGSTNIEYVALFDIYTGERVDQRKKALGFEISFRSNEKTLTDVEVQHAFDHIQNELLKFYEIRKIS